MPRHGLAGPGGTFLVCGMVTDGKDEIHLRRIGGLEFRDMFGPQRIDAVALGLQHLDRKGIKLGPGQGARRIGGEPVARHVPQDRLCKDGTGGVAGTYEKHVELCLGHHLRPVNEVRERGRAEISAPPTTIHEQPRYDLARRIKVDGIQEPRPVAPLRDQPDLRQRRQIYRRRAGFQRQHLRDFPRRQGIGIAPHQQAKHGQPLRVAQGGESICE